MQQDWSVLDIGAGEGLMAELMAPMAEKIVCVEPSPPRAEILRNYGYEVYESPWLETDLKEKFDLVLSCRSFGVSAISQGQPEISSSLLKMNAAARKKAVIIIPELELFKLPVSELFPDGLSRTPYLLHLGALLAMGVFPELRFFRRFYQVCYSSLEDCFLTGFGRYPWSEAQAVEIKKVLKNCITETENGFLRNREMLTSVVSWEPVKV
jgi:SAM-dependent methyltransferase